MRIRLNVRDRRAGIHSPPRAELRPGINPGPTVMIAVLVLALFACDDGKKKEPRPVLLAADPPSLPLGESVVATITAEKKFFTVDITAPITSQGGLVIESLTVQDKRTALISISSDEETELGEHRFLFEMEDETGQLDVSVIAEAPGPGSVTATGTTATAGARNALLQLAGHGTHFDQNITVEVEGADGFEVWFVDLVTEQWIDITYNIALDQEPCEATVVVIDGIYRYEVPFTILSPPVYENQVQDQALTKGQVGWITLSHPNAQLNSGTGLDGSPEGIAWGDPAVVDATEVAIPIRVPFDYEDDYLEVTAFTYSQMGAFLELMTAEIALLESAWIAAVPSRLVDVPGEQIVELVAQGVDLTAVETLTLEADEQLVLAGWEATAADAGSATFVLGSEAVDGQYLLHADDGYRDITGTVLLPGFGFGTFPAWGPLVAGDRFYLPIVVQGIDLVEETTVFEGNDDIQVLGLTHVDEGCAVAEIAVQGGSYIGLHQLWLSNGSEDLHVFLWVEESGL